MHQKPNITTSWNTVFGGGLNGQHPEEEDISHFKQYPCLDPITFYGIIGRIARAIEPETEADPAAIIAQLLIAAGCAIGHGPFFQVGATRHYTNLFSCLVGRTSRGRKGSAIDYVIHIMCQVDGSWIDAGRSSGLSSGEGLIYAVRDRLVKKEEIKQKGKLTGEVQEITVDFGVDDKRLFVTEGEFSRPLKAMSREGNILSEVMRSAWESGNLRTMVRTNPYKATDAHISIVGHITYEELQKSLLECEFFNGFANRILWLVVQRSKLLPNGGSIPHEQLKPAIAQLTDTIQWARDACEMFRSAEADEFWASIYGDLTAEAPGRFGAATSRSEAQVLRLSMIFALLDKTITIRTEHIKAALALWQYCVDSERYLFVESFDDPHAQKILSALRHSPRGMTRAEINIDVFGRHLTKIKLDKALTYLRQLQMAKYEIEPTAGRPIERWLAMTPKKDNEDYD